MDRVLLLVPSASYRAADFLAAARALDLQVIVGCNEPLPLGDETGSRQICLDDPDAAAEAIVALDSESPLDAVVAVDDQGTVVAARAAERLGLRANSPDAVAATRDKLRMRSMLAAAEVSQPAFAPVSPGAGPAELARVTEVIGLPCVVKPTSLSGSQGVIRADTLEQARRALERVRSIAAGAGAATDQPLLVERFVSGPEVAVEGVLSNGELTVLAVFDKPDPLEGPFFEETLYVTPSRLGTTDLQAVVMTTQAAARALKLREGPVHAELRVREGRSWVIEVAARSIGGLCSRTLQFGTGLSLEYLILAHALGRPVASFKRSDGAARSPDAPDHRRWRPRRGHRARACSRGAGRGRHGADHRPRPQARAPPRGEPLPRLRLCPRRAPRSGGGCLEGRTRGASRPPGAGTTSQAPGRPDSDAAGPPARCFASATVWRPKWKIEAASNPSA